MRGLLSETVNHKFSAEGIALWVPTLDERERYLLLMLADFGTAVFSAKLIVHVIALGTLWF